MLLCGGGGYVLFEVLSSTGESVDWVKGDAMLDTICNHVPKINDSLFTTIFGKRNNSCKRCLLHLKSGSFDIEQVEATYSLKRNLAPSDKIVVVKALSMPSQKLGSGDMYSTRMTIKLAVNGAATTSSILLAPESCCDCSVGMFFCTH